MEATSHERVMQVLADALEVDPAQRGVYLDHTCGLDAELRAEVERLLLGAGKAHEAIPTGLGADQLTAQFLPPTQIGPYRIIRTLGEGGMGVVYLAMQEHPVRRTVALKLIRPGMDSREIVARFESERQALALMHHPNVAHVYDAGADERGRPYFVMEYVDGRPITDWCDEQRLGIRARLELFAHVCDAVQHAHTKGIIHRDLKPTNVLVTLHQDRPVPKVIDFGIAKAVERPAPDERSLLTVHGQLVGTPEYMSPEQAGGKADIDTRTDVYALGVMLYELLTGALPFDRKMLRSSARDEMRRIIREVDAQRPSTRLSRLEPQTAGTVASQRGLAPAALRRALRGDLDWIVMKALEKDRERRYASPRELAGEIARHLGDEPVIAGPPTRRYRASKFVRRHRNIVVGTLLVSLAMLGGIAATTWQAVRATRAERLVRQEKQLAERRFNDLRKLAGRFMFDVDETLQTAGPTRARQQLVNTALEYLDALAREAPADTSLGLELVEGYLRVGNVQYFPGSAHLGDIEGALASYRKALALAQRIEAEHPRDPKAVRFLGGCWVYLAEAQADSGDASAAMQSFANARRKFEECARLAPDDLLGPRNVGLVCEKLAYLYKDIGRGADSLASRLESLRIYESLLERHPGNAMLERDVTLAHGGLASLLMDMGRVVEALPHAQRALERSEARLAKHGEQGHVRRDTLLFSKDLATIHRLLGHEPDAIAPARRALELAASMVEADSSNRQARRDLAGAYGTLGGSLIYASGTVEAVEALRRAIDIRNELLQETPADHQLIGWIANARDSLATALRRAGNLGEALAEAQAAVRMQQQRLEKDPDNSGIKSSLIEASCELAQVLLEQDRPAEAVRQLEGVLPKPLSAVAATQESSEIDELVDRRFMLPALVCLAEARHRAGDLENAVTPCDDALRIARVVLAQSDGDDCTRGWLARTLARRGLILLEQGDVDRAKKAIAESVTHAQRVASNPSCGTEAREALWHAHVARAKLLDMLGRDTDADESWHAAYEVARRISEADAGDAHARRLMSHSARQP